MPQYIPRLEETNPSFTPLVLDLQDKSANALDSDTVDGYGFDSLEEETSPHSPLSQLNHCLMYNTPEKTLLLLPVNTLDHYMKSSGFSSQEIEGVWSARRRMIYDGESADLNSYKNVLMQLTVAHYLLMQEKLSGKAFALEDVNEKAWEDEEQRVFWEKEDLSTSTTKQDLIIQREMDAQQALEQGISLSNYEPREED